MKKTLTLASIALLLFSCAPKIYKSAEFDSALSKHKTVAILPAAVSMQLRPNESKKVSPEQFADMVNKTSLEIQDKMYSWFLRRSDKMHYTVTFQDVTKTNSLLKNANITIADLATKDRAELAKLLGVDAVLQNSSKMEKPMSEGAAVAVGLLVGAWGSTNKVSTTINIHDGKSGNLLWKYDYNASGSVGSSSDNLINALMRNASRKFPYKS
jgi:hypothetical protein